MNTVFMGINRRKWRSNEVSVPLHKRGLPGAIPILHGTGSDIAPLIAAFEAHVANGTATRAEGYRLIGIVGDQVDSVCREFGDTSERCQNMKAAFGQLYSVVNSLPVDVERTYGLGWLVGAGVAGGVLGALAVYFWKKR